MRLFGFSEYRSVFEDQRVRLIVLTQGSYPCLYQAIAHLSREFSRTGTLGLHASWHLLVAHSGKCPHWSRGLCMRTMIPGIFGIRSKHGTRKLCQLTVSLGEHFAENARCVVSVPFRSPEDEYYRDGIMRFSKRT